MKRFVLLILSVLASTATWSKDYTVKSPDNRITIIVSIGPGLRWSASYDGKQVIKSNNVGLELKSGKILGDERVKKVDTKKLDETIFPIVANKRSEIKNRCNILEINFKSGSTLVFRAYDDGIAYRFETNMKDDLVIRNEIADFEFPRETTSWYPLEEGFFSKNEINYAYSSLDTIGKNHLASLPVLFKSEGINVLMSEADLDDYPGMWLLGQGSRKISGVWPKFPSEETFRNNYDMVVTETKGYIAQTKGTRTFPWKVFIMSSADVDLAGSDMVYRLSKPSQIEETDWIKTGKVACDSWNETNIYNVKFRAGINNETYKYYIDFASDNGLEFIILDKGWYENDNVTDEAEGINVYDLCEYGKSRNVGVLLGVRWKLFWDRMDEAVGLFEKWGVSGIKIDLIQRDDQRMVNSYYDAARKAAEHHLLVNFHDGSMPAGLNKVWPNVLTNEGVKGLELSKQNREVTPDYDVTIPFIRMTNGPMDYAPGAMVNMDKESFSPKVARPESQGTRAHQVAMYVIYESPLQMLADSPTNYMREQETVDFIKNIPVVWDEIACLDGKVGDFILLARKSGNDWFVGAMTDWNERTIDIDFSFLPEGKYKVDGFQDGINADRNASDYEIVRSEIKSGGRMRIHMAPGGGWAARVTPIL
ncbi:MAG TPA: glycoside hydrolase family 97 protein [Bacteroidales bacterium]|nr:glycoside hydrolase family 97 protein [Bacteroidales bacterium]